MARTLNEEGACYECVRQDVMRHARELFYENEFRGALPHSVDSINWMVV